MVYNENAQRKETITITEDVSSHKKSTQGLARKYSEDNLRFLNRE
jgi:hypothetical protein